MHNTNNNVNTEIPVKQPGQLGHMAKYYDLITAFMTFGREKRLRQLTVQLAQLKPGDKVLEVGCGTGNLTIAAKKQVGQSGEVIGIDIAPEMITVATRKAARKKVDIKLVTASIEKIPFDDNTFDYVLCSFMIHHMPEYVRLNGIKEVYRVLKPGGHLFVLDFTLPEKTKQRNLVRNHSGYMMQHDVRELKPVLENNSFTEIEMENTDFLGTWFIRGKAEK
jgi:ubiquinone/menaquinone biosynthesis methyltransferase